eukprot:TRINITY_DN34456_c0_g1_i1.p1 TRINITY_DN34456_c0_g1~~TRINITY_DN34456_c0_g1_i1.p1  ORF type:complete len:1702 (-),score=292.40 TRINITY_DN34456_c0_g1_i1:339-5444(-)
MVLSEEERALKAREETSFLARKKAERERILAETRADRERFNAVHSSEKPATAPQKPMVLIRLRYDVNGQKGRRPFELEGTTATVSLFHLLQGIAEEMDVAVTRLVLHPADESKWPLEPREDMLPSFSSFDSIELFPSLDEVGVRSGQELFLSLSPELKESAVVTPATPETAISFAQNACASEATGSVFDTADAIAHAYPSTENSSPRPAPTHIKAAEMKTVDTPAPMSAPISPVKPPAGSGASAVQYSEAQRLKYMWRTMEGKKLAMFQARMQRETAEIDVMRNTPEAARLAGLLLWSPEELAFYARLKADLQRTVGLEPVKEFIVQRFRDAAGRHVLKEGKQPRRHVLISGHFGVGKRYATELIGRLFALLSGNISGGRVRVGARVRLAAQSDPENRGALLSRDDVGVVKEELPPGNARPFKVQGPSGRNGNYRESELLAEVEYVVTLKHLSDLVDPKTQKINVTDGVCYFLRLDVGGMLSEADGAILEAVSGAQSILIIAGSQASIEGSAQISAFRRRQPELLELPTLGPTELARMIAAEAERRGYASVGEGDAGTPQIVTVLEHIVRQRFDEALIREKNAHLAQDILELAISRKNDRTWEEPLDSAERFRLTPVDFGLDVLTAEQRERRLQEVHAEVSGLVGWGDEDETGTPRNFFAMFRRQAKGKVGCATDDAQPAHLPRSLWVTANPGAGSSKFVQLAARFLRACGATSREEVVLVDGSDLVAAGDGFLNGRLAAASRGCLAITGVDALVDSRDGLRAILGALEGSEGNSTLVVLVGSPVVMSRLSRMEPAFESRFTTRIRIPDFSAEELVEYVQKEATSLPSGALALEDGLPPRLALHINEMYGGGSTGKEVREHGNLALAQKLLQRAIQNRITRLFNRIQEGEHPGGKPESEYLTPEDFEIGAPLGEGAEQKAAIDEEVRRLVGMSKAKDWFDQVRQKVAFVEKTGTQSDLRVCLNIIITGNPGTGKTTFARLLAKFFHTYGVLSKDSFVEKNGLELKAEYMGGTAPRVKAAVQEALGGCLFLDEAYALVDSSQGVGNHGDIFSQEAMRTLLTEVENNRTNLMVVLAGYKDKMGRMMRADEGLARRFPNRLHLDDYSPAELAAICETAASQKHQRAFEPGLRDKLARHIEHFFWRDIPQQNAGLAVNMTEQALDRQIVRIVRKFPSAFVVSHGRGSSSSVGKETPSLSRQQSAGSSNLHTIKQEVAYFTTADFGIEERPTLGDPELRAQVRTAVQSLVGMENVKAFFDEMAQSVAFVERGGDPKVLQTSLNLRLVGNPGTGKTTVARLIARYLHAHGVLPRDSFVERNALVLKGQFVGQSAPTVVEAVRDAMGGCLFIDEAYALADRGGDKFSGEVVRTLLTEVENNRTGLLVVLAGYADKMEHLMDADPGLRRRFALILSLEDYSPFDLAAICQKVAEERFQLSFAPGLSSVLAKHIESVHGSEISQHNGGLSVTLVERAFRRLATRLGRAPVGDVVCTHPSSRELCPEDFGITDADHASGSGYNTCVGREVPLMPPKKHRRRDGARHHDGASKKRGRERLHQAVGRFAQELAAQVIRGFDDCDSCTDDDDAMSGGGLIHAAPRSDRDTAVAKALAKAKEREREKSVVKEEEALPQQEGERIIEEVSTVDALDRLGLCPANFEWFELNPANPPPEDCGICGYRLADGYRCGGGTHFVCMGCIDAYKTRDVREN